MTDQELENVITTEVDGLTSNARTLDAAIGLAGVASASHSYPNAAMGAAVSEGYAR